MKRRHLAMTLLCALLVSGGWAMAGGPLQYDKVLYPITQPMHVDLTVEHENFYEIYMAISGFCHDADPYCTERQCWDAGADAPMLGGGRILFKAVGFDGTPASFRSLPAAMHFYFGYAVMPDVDKRLPRAVALHGERAGGLMTTFEGGPMLSFHNLGESLAELEALELRGLRFLRPDSTALRTRTAGDEATIDLMMHECVVEDVVHGDVPGTYYSAIALVLEHAGLVSVRNSRILRTNPDPALAEIGIWSFGRSGPQYADFSHNEIQTSITPAGLQSGSILFGAFSWDPAFTEPSVYNLVDNDLLGGATSWTPAGLVNISRNRITTSREALWLTTQPDTVLLVTHNDIEMLESNDWPFRLGIASWGLGFHGGLIAANKVRGEARHGAYVTFGSTGAKFRGNNMKQLETSDALYFFDETTSGNLVIGYTDRCNVVDLGTDNCIVGCGCFWGP